MSDDLIAAALRQAAAALCWGPAGIECDTCLDASQCCKAPMRMNEAAATVAAFLRACPLVSDQPGGIGMGFHDADARERWALTVERVA
jgi:hypothetical protein